jgi:hypothetical protein
VVKEILLAAGMGKFSLNSPPFLEQYLEYHLHDVLLRITFKIRYDCTYRPPM